MTEEEETDSKITIKRDFVEGTERVEELDVL